MMDGIILSGSEKDNSLKTTPVLAQRWAVWSILTKNQELRTYCYARTFCFIPANTTFKDVG